MGKKRAMSCRRMAETFIVNYPNKFSTDFEENKKCLNEITDFPSKVIRNTLAGYIARLMKTGLTKSVRITILEASRQS